MDLLEAKLEHLKKQMARAGIVDFNFNYDYAGRALMLEDTIGKIKTICENYECDGIGQCCGCGKELADKILEVLECPNG